MIRIYDETYFGMLAGKYHRQSVSLDHARALAAGNAVAYVSGAYNTLDDHAEVADALGELLGVGVPLVAAESLGERVAPAYAETALVFTITRSPYTDHGGLLKWSAQTLEACGISFAIMTRVDEPVSQTGTGREEDLREALGAQESDGKNRGVVDPRPATKADLAREAGESQAALEAAVGAVELDVQAKPAIESGSEAPNLAEAE